VRSMSYSVDGTVWQRAGNRADGEVLDLGKL
jgi:hypothetical protein